MSIRKPYRHHETWKHPAPLPMEALELIVGGANSMTSAVINRADDRGIMQSVEPVLEYAGNRQLRMQL